MEKILLDEILDSFKIKGNLVKCERYGSGHINDTNLLVTEENGKERCYVLQRINKRVFKDPPSLMNNFGAVTDYLKNIFKERGDDYRRKTLNLVKTKDGKYYYDITVDADGVSSTVTYKNGTQTVVSGGESYDVPQSEDEAKEFIASLINDPSLGYNAEQVTNIKKKNDGVWEIELAVADSATFEELFKTLGGTYESATQTVTVTVQDERLIRIKNEIVASGSITQGRDTYKVSWNLAMETAFID